MSYATSFAHVNIYDDYCDTVRVREPAGTIAAAMSEFVVVAFMRFIMTTCEGFTVRRCDDPRLRISTPRSIGHRFPGLVLFLRLPRIRLGPFTPVYDLNGLHIPLWDLRDCRWKPLRCRERLVGRRAVF